MAKYSKLEGKDFMTTDDSREVDWPEKQINKLRAELDVAFGAATRLEDRIKELEQQVPVGCCVGAGLTNRINLLVDRAARIEADLGERALRIEADLSGTDRAVMTLNERVSRLEVSLEDDEPSARDWKRLTDRVAALENHPRRDAFEGIQISGEDQFSAPIGGRSATIELKPGDMSSRSIDILTGGVVQQHENRAKARETTLELAEDRVRKYLRRYTLTDEFVRGIVRALRGEL
jgi:hypothetical protein